MIPPWLIRLQTIWKCQIAWGQISFLLGVLGNIFTLYATTAHNAIKLDKMSIWIIKNLAVADICNCFLVVLPILIYQYGSVHGLQTFDETFHEILACYRYMFFVANLFLVNVLSLNKLLRCLFPLRNLVTTKRQKFTVTMTTVIVSAVPSIWEVYVIKSGFADVNEEWKLTQYSGAALIGGTDHDIDKFGVFRFALGRIIICIFNALPCLTLIVINSSLITYALWKANSTVNMKNILTVIMVTGVFLTSILPYFVNYVLMFFWKQSLEFEEIAWSISYLSTWINPFIYLAVNPSFRKFTAGKLSFWKRNQRVENIPPPGGRHR